MVEIRFHGRGGQGAVTSAELLVIAAINEGKYGLALPSFGPERRGAPVMAFARISDSPIRIRSGVWRPDIIVVLDPGLLKNANVFQGLKEDGIVVVNATERPSLPPGIRVAWVNATQIARGEIGLPITNTTMLGALVKAVPLVKVESFLEPLNKRFGKVGEKNFKALKRAYEETRVER